MLYVAKAQGPHTINVMDLSFTSIFAIAVAVGFYLIWEHQEKQDNGNDGN